jgi:hypothetical protein
MAATYQNDTGIHGSACTDTLVWRRRWATSLPPSFPPLPQQHEGGRGRNHGAIPPSPFPPPLGPWTGPGLGRPGSGQTWALSTVLLALKRSRSPQAKDNTKENFSDMANLNSVVLSLSIAILWSTYLRPRIIWFSLSIAIFSVVLLLSIAIAVMSKAPCSRQE